MSTEKEWKEVLEMAGNLAKQCIASTEGSAPTSSMNRAWWALTDKLSALLAELEAAREDAARWKHMLRVIGAQTQLGRANFVVVGLDAPMNVMRGSVAEHFTKAIDAARKGEA